MKIVSGIVRFLSWLVCLIIIISLAIAAPILFGYKPVVVLSGSMEPAYPTGSVTYYKQADFSNIAVGDVITFTIGDGALATHRAIAIDEAAQTISTKGDHNDSADANPVSYSSVKGKAVKIAIPYAGFFVKRAQNWYVIVGCAIILLLDMLLSSGKKKKTGPEDQQPISDKTDLDNFFDDI